jgi:hypothetical protein
MEQARTLVSGWISKAIALSNEGKRDEARQFLRRKASGLKALPFHQMPPAWAFHGQALIETLQITASEL